MKYTRVFVDAIGYELAPVVVSSGELEERLQPLYQKLHISEGQLEALTGIVERRWWEEDYPLSQGAVAAARKALEAAQVPPEDVEVVIYGGVCREQFEPATACRVAAGLRVSSEEARYDPNKACPGVLNRLVANSHHIPPWQNQEGVVGSLAKSRDVH